MLKKLNKNDNFTLRDHIENSRDKMIKGYTLAQLQVMEWIGLGAVKNRISKKFIPVRFDHALKIDAYRRWKSPVPYSVKYIRLDELLSYLQRASGKKVKLLMWEEIDRYNNAVRLINELSTD